MSTVVSYLQIHTWYNQLHYLLYNIILQSFDKDFLEVTLGLENYKDMMHTVFNALTCNNY